jgi:hypothetical protein
MSDAPGAITARLTVNRVEVLGFLRATVETVADEVRPIDDGWVVRSTALPQV